MIQKNIIVPKTARYFQLGEFTEQTETVWFVCHGYAQMANYFIKKFDVLDTNKNLIIAPEGLHRFYWKGFSDRVVASWMTKEDRTNDIKDYVNFLEMVYKEVLSSFKNKNVKINVLGFSQGTATVCRWIANNKSQVDNLILWAGGMPNDLNFENDKPIFNKMKNYLVIGNEDEFINEKQVAEQTDLLLKNNISFELIRFDGTHEIPPDVLLNLANKL